MDKEVEISSLPLRRVKIGEEIKTVRCDADNNRIYLLDADGNYTGQSASIPAGAMTAQDAQAQVAQAEPEKGTEDALEDTDSEPDEEAPCESETPVYLPQDDVQKSAASSSSNGKKSSRKPLSVLRAIGGFLMYILPVVMSVVILYAIFLLPERIEQHILAARTTPTESPTVQTEPSATEETPTAPQHSVLTPSKALLPGQAIRAEDLTSIAVSGAEYASVMAYGGVYMEGDELDGLIAVQYIPQGSYIPYGALATSYTPANPWSALTADTYELPITGDIPFVCWGDVLTIEVTVKENVPPATAAGQTAGSPTEPGGGAEVESTVLNTYKLTGVTVSDILGKDGSLYPQYTALTQIPAAYKAQSIAQLYEDRADALTPQTLVLSVTPEQAALLARLDMDEAQIKASKTGVTVLTQPQEEAYTVLAEIVNITSGKVMGE